jgi:hypothetical protein
VVLDIAYPRRGGERSVREEDVIVRTAAVVNCSAPHYNLGAEKLADWLTEQGYAVARYSGDVGAFVLGYDLVALSVVFSWHATIARDLALIAKPHGDIWVGGPGVFALKKWWAQETGLGLAHHQPIDARFDKQRGNYRMTFASRGCPVGCWFCIVPRLEGSEFTLDPEFVPAPILCDNNLSALPVDYQEHIIRRYRETSTRLLDANSGFEPATFDGGTYERWEPLLRESEAAWRFAYDESHEGDAVKRVLRILEPVRSRRKRVYVLVGNEPFEACYERAMKVVEWGGEPHCQFVLPLNCLSKDAAGVRVKHGWTYQLGQDFCRYFNAPGIRKKASLAEYKPRLSEPPPFAAIA